MIHDAQYLSTDMPGKRGWGHSVVDDVLALARDSECRAIALHHHDPDRDDDALDAIANAAASWATDRVRAEPDDVRGERGPRDRVDRRRPAAAEAERVA